jgi:hypothetical protein
VPRLASAGERISDSLRPWIAAFKQELLAVVAIETWGGGARRRPSNDTELGTVRASYSTVPFEVRVRVERAIVPRADQLSYS